MSRCVLWLLDMWYCFIFRVRLVLGEFYFSLYINYITKSRKCKHTIEWYHFIMNYTLLYTHLGGVSLICSYEVFELSPKTNFYSNTFLGLLYDDTLFYKTFRDLYELEVKLDMLWLQNVNIFIRLSNLWEKKRFGTYYL